MLNVFCIERPSEEGAPLGSGQNCGSSSCEGSLRSLLNTKGILTLPMFLLSNGSWIKMWSACFAWWCRVLLSLSYCEIYKFYFWVFCGDVVISDGTGGFISLVCNSFFQGPVGFTYVFSCEVVGRAFPVVDYISFLCIWNWIFWMHKQGLDGTGTFKENPNSVFC